MTMMTSYIFCNCLNTKYTKQFLLGLFLTLSTIMLFAQTYEDGRQDYINGDYQAAYDKLRPLADAGDAKLRR